MDEVRRRKKKKITIFTVIGLASEARYSTTAFTIDNYDDFARHVRTKAIDVLLYFLVFS